MEEKPNLIGLGECSIIPKLSIDYRPDFEAKLAEVIASIDNYAYWLEEGLAEFPSIRFGLETALLDLQLGAKRLLFRSEFTNGRQAIPINGLVWMGDYKSMYKQIKDKIECGYRCVKLKIGAIDFEKELQLLALIRKDFDEREMELRVDANGAFSAEEAMAKLERLSKYKLHSIEQPISQGQWEAMASLCKQTPIPIALDEELITVNHNRIEEMLKTIMPQYIILKPSLLGGFSASQKFIHEAEKQEIGWWVTSALESNIGLNAIAQWTHTLNNPMPQGLGTGQLFTNNMDSPLVVKQASLFHMPDVKWNLNKLFSDE